MNHNRIFALFCLLPAFALAALAFAPAPASAEPPKVMDLPAPDKTGGKPLMQALNERCSTRSFTDAPLSAQDLSNLLWATWGINREDGRHTAPTAKNKQEVAVYAALPDGVWLYNPVEHKLELYLAKDVRGAISAEAPLALLYAAPADDDDAGLHIGALYQNAGLYCASANLGSVVKLTGADEADKLLGLTNGYQVRIVQPVGHPK